MSKLNVYILGIFTCFTCLFLAHVSSAQPANEIALQFCPFFGNRAPHPQPNLKNCTRYRENSCCRQEEIDATFGKVKPLPGSSPECQRYINHLMCYICSPNQYLVYSRERLTVCEEFCEGWFIACAKSILKGSLIKELYPNGKEFCLSRSFLVDKQSRGKCFTYDEAWHTSGVQTASTFNFLVFDIFLLWLNFWW